MSYVAAEARQELLDAIAEAADDIAFALAALGEAFDALDEPTGDRLEEQLFRPVQHAYGRIKRTHSEFAGRYQLPTHQFAAANQPAPARPALLIEDAGEAVLEADDKLATLQDSMKPIEVGDAELRAGLSEVRQQLDLAAKRAEGFARTMGR
jgi:hypothetical protein